MSNIKHYLPHFFKKKRVELGEGHVMAYTVFEWKPLFSIIVYNWLTIKQNRFHSHAFPAVAFLLSGKYEEEVKVNGKTYSKTVNQWLKPRYIPRNYVHRVLKSDPNTWTIIFVGPWHKWWYEYFEDTGIWCKYLWGRKMVGKTNEFPEELRKESKICAPEIS
jgi:hypothetical protein